MRKSFTRFSSVLVLLFLSIQLVIAAPSLVTNGLSPSDGGVLDPTNPVFTLTFKSDVQAGEGEIIGLYNNDASEPEGKAIQLRPQDKTAVGDVVTYTHTDGTVVFNANVVTITFNGVDWKTAPDYWITLGSSAISDITGNFNVATAFDGGAMTNRWDFKVKDLNGPKVVYLTPHDNSVEVPTGLLFGMSFDELVTFTGTEYTQMLEDFAVYTSVNTGNVITQEGGDLVTLLMPTITMYRTGVVGSVGTSPDVVIHPMTVINPIDATIEFDSITIEWANPPSLPPHTSLYVRVQPGLFEDLSGNLFAGINNETDWNFDTKDDLFNEPTISYIGAPANLTSNNKFTVDFDDNEKLYMASSGAVISNNQDLKALVSVVNKDDEALSIKNAKISTSTNTITIELNSVMVSTDSPFTVCISAGVFKDQSGNFSKGKCETFAAGNWDAPKLENAYVSNQSGTSFDLLLETNEAAYVHYVVVRKDPAIVPTTNEVFGHSKDLNTNNVVVTEAIHEGTNNNDVFYRIGSLIAATPDITSWPTEDGNYGEYYGKQTAADKWSLVEIFAEGDVYIPEANFEVLERVVDLPATHGFNDDPTAEYEIYYVLIDTMDTDGKYDGSNWLTDPAAEHISAVQKLDKDVYTIDILMPEAWFDGDTILNDEFTPLINDINQDLPYEGALETLARDGNLYINFNETIRKNNGQEFSSDPATQDAELQACLWVYENAPTVTAPPSGVNTDLGWSTNYGYTASLSADKKQIVIEPDSSWASESTIWVKIINSKIEDNTGNEVVPYDANGTDTGDLPLYTQDYTVEDYSAPIVRYSYENILTPMDGLTNIPYQKFVEGNFVTTTIDVTIDEHIFVFPGALIDGNIVSNDNPLMKFSNDKDEDTYIGNFFKIRKGDGTTVDESSSDPIEKLFTFTIDYTYGDSTKITIIPDTLFDSEIWYFIEIDERIQDSNLLTIAQGNLEADVDKSPYFTDEAVNGIYATTGNLTLAAPLDEADNKTMVFKTDDSRNPVLTFFSKKQSALTGSSLLDELVILDELHDVVIDDTIGVFIDEYVSLGFDHFVHFDALSGEYELDANAMRRYFKVFDDDSIEMQFDIVDIFTVGLDPAKDSMVFYIDPYYVDDDGLPILNSENKNFVENAKYTVYFNSTDLDDNGTDERNGKEKGIYWDDNNNLVVVTYAQFYTTITNSECLSATITPTPELTNMTPGDQYITFTFDNGVDNANIPILQYTEGTSSVFTAAGAWVPGHSNAVQYPVTFASDSAYTIDFGAGFTDAGQLHVNSIPGMAWPLNDCDEPQKLDSTWHYTMRDGTPPELDTFDITISYIVYTDITIPMDDEINFDMTKDIVMNFDEDVVLNTGKRLTIYDSANRTVATVSAQYCQYGYYMDGADKKTDESVIVVPSARFANKLDYNTPYHIIVDKGFVTDKTGNLFDGILTEDLSADNSEDGDNDWSFETGDDPAPYFTEFSPADGQASLADMRVTFSEPVYAAGTAAEPDQIKIYEVTSASVYVLVDMFRSSSNKISASADHKTWTIDISELDETVDIEKQYVVEIPAAAFEDNIGTPLAYPCMSLGVTYYNGLGTLDITTPEDSPAVWRIIYDDVVAPYVMNVFPRDGYEHIAYNSYIYIEFNEPIALSDGSAVIPDPNLLEQTIDEFITLSRLGDSDVDFDVEFVGNDKQLLRITPFDPEGYRYDPNIDDNPTMKPYTEYTVYLDDGIVGGYQIVDLNQLPMDSDYDFSFTTEDIVAPVLSNPVVDASDCANKVNFQFDAIEASDTLNVYWAILPAGDAAPTAASLFDQSVNATKKGINAGNAGTPGVDFTVEMGDFPENPEFVLYAVTEDLEVDIWANPVPGITGWDSLFMFGGNYGEGYDRIRDILPSPNRNYTVVAAPKFMIWDNDAPLMLAEYPVRGAVQVPVEVVVKFTMSEDIVLGSLDINSLEPDSITLRRYDNNIAVDAYVAWNGADSTITITPLEKLKQETKYYVEIDRYAIEDELNVCTDNTVFFPQWVGRDYSFTTEDNIGPRFVKANPENGEDCVSCPDLNVDGEDVMELTFYDANAIIVNPKATDKFIYFYRADLGDEEGAWDVVAANDENISVAQGSTDTTWVVSVKLAHVYYPNDLINVVVPAGLFSDVYGNPYTNDVFAYLDGVNDDQVDFDFTTCNTEAPAVTWAIHALNGFFNYSETTSIDDGIFGDWISAATYGDKGATVTGVSTHAALKVDFGEDVEFHTGSGNEDSDWESLAGYTDGNTGLTNSEIMSILKVSGLQYKDQSGSDFAKKSDIKVLDVSGTTVTLGFRTASDAAKLPVYDLLVTAQSAGNVDGGVYPFLDDWYYGSLESETPYDVTVAEGKVRATVNCLDDASPRLVESDIVNFTTRNDIAPTADIVNADGESLCETEVCIAKDEILTINFSDPVVKTSYDVLWLGEESFSFDNLPLNESDLTATGTEDHGQYIEFYKVIRTVATDGAVTFNRIVGADPIAVHVVALDDAMMNYQIVPQDNFDSEGWYEIKLNKYTVKKFENNGPNGTVFEGYTCHFFVGDYIDIDYTSLLPSGNNIASDYKNLIFVVDESPALGTGTMKLRREDGTVFAEFDASEGVISNKVASNPDTIAFAIGKDLEEFTKYYIEAPKGFITDDNEICEPNPLAAIEHRLGLDGELLDADWWFRTTDATPPQLISVDRENEVLDPNALFPAVGGTVSKNSVLEMRFDENIDIDPNPYAGIVIYHDNGQNPDENFGNAVEFIPWSKVYASAGNNFNQIELSGSDVYNGLDYDIVTIDPNIEFIANGTYYVRVNGLDITDFSGNTWETRKSNGQLDGTGLFDQIIDTEWWFTVTNDVEPVLVATTPDYDGVNNEGVYAQVPSLPIAYVQTDLTMTFEDGNGLALDVAPGDDQRILRIFEYTYDAASAGFKSKPWIEMPITHDSIEFVGNQVIVHGVILRDGITSMLPSTGIATDSCYYVTVDRGAVLNGYDLSETWWPGIPHGDRWRFTTGSDDVAPILVDIVSPNVVDDADLAKDLTIEVASELIVEFNEGVEALAAPTGMVKVYNADVDTLVESIVVTAEMCEGLILTVPVANLYDESNFYVVVEAGSFGDTSTVSVPNDEFGGRDVWSFHTGDNTAPVPVTAIPDADCAVASPVLVLTYDETINDDRTGVVENVGTVVITNEADEVIASLTEADIDVLGNTVTIDLMAAGVVLPDTTLLTVTLSEGLVLDGDVHSPLPSTEYMWSFTTGENTLPFATLSPAFVITPDTVLTLTFNEVVNSATLEGIVTVNGDTVTLVSTDSIVYTAQLTELMSETIYDVVIAEGAFMDENAGCTSNGNAEATLTFEVDDIAAPVATYYPSLVGDYRDLELVIVFDEAVEVTEGYVVIYTEAGDFADSIEVGEFATTDNITYTYTTNDLFFGSYYVMIDAGTFVDESAAAVGVEYAGISTDDEWIIDITDPSFENCMVIVSPEDGEINVAVDTELEMTFECEVIKPGAADIRYVTIAKQDDAGQEFIKVEIVDSLISEDGHSLIVPVSGLEELTTYSVTIAPGAIEDEAGNQFAGIIDANTWNFTTGDATDPIVTLVADTVNNLDGAAVITSNEAGTVYLVHTDVPANVAAITAAITEGKAVTATVVAVDEAITVSTAGLVEGLYYAVATDVAGNVGESVDQVLIVNIPEVTIAEIQGDGDVSPLEGKIVTTTGVVTGKDGDGFFIQDANAIRSGIWVYGSDLAANVGVGTGIKVSGTVYEFYGFTEIKDLIDFEFVAPVITVTPLVVDAADLAEDYEGVLVVINYLKTTVLPSEDSFGEWMTQDAEGVSVKVDEQLFAFTPEMHQSYKITGVVNYSYDEFKLAPRSLDDITYLSIDPDLALGKNIRVYPNPFTNVISLNVPSEVVLTKAVITNLAGQIVIEVSNPEKSIETTQLLNGVYFISLHTEDGIAKTSRIIKR